MTFPIVSYNHSDRSKTYRYSRKLISPKVTVQVYAADDRIAIDADMSLTFQIYSGDKVIWSWDAPAVSQDGSGGVRPGGGISWPMPNGVCRCWYSFHVPPGSDRYQWRPGSYGAYSFVLEFSDLAYESDGSLDVGITVRGLHPNFNNTENTLKFRIEDTANNATQPTGPGPN